MLPLKESPVLLTPGLIFAIESLTRPLKILVLFDYIFIQKNMTFTLQTLALLQHKI